MQYINKLKLILICATNRLKIPIKSECVTTEQKTGPRQNSKTAFNKSLENKKILFLDAKIKLWKMLTFDIKYKLTFTSVWSVWKP